MPKKFEERILNTLAQHRKQLNLSQQELADAVHVSRQTIIAIEKGNYAPSVLLAMKIARYCNLSVEDIFSYE